MRLAERVQPSSSAFGSNEADKQLFVRLLDGTTYAQLIDTLAQAVGAGVERLYVFAGSADAAQAVRVALEQAVAQLRQVIALAPTPSERDAASARMRELSGRLARKPSSSR